MLSFGVTNGPPTYCLLVEMVLWEISSSVTIGFFDDGLIHSWNVDQQQENLAWVLTAYHDGGPETCSQ